MAKRSKRSSRRRGGPLKSLMSSITKTAGKLILPITLVNAVPYNITINPASLGAHLEGFATLFGQYRFTRMAIKLFPVAHNIAMAYVPDSLQTSTPSTFLEISQFAESQFHASSQITPTYHSLSRKALLGMSDLKWIQTRETGATGVDSNWVTQGTLWLLSDGDTSAYVEFAYDIEFCAPRTPTDYLRLVNSDSESLSQSSSSRYLYVEEEKSQMPMAVARAPSLRASARKPGP